MLFKKPSLLSEILSLNHTALCSPGFLVLLGGFTNWSSVHTPKRQAFGVMIVSIHQSASSHSCFLCTPLSLVQPCWVFCISQGRVLSQSKGRMQNKPAAPGWQVSPGDSVPAGASQAYLFCWQMSLAAATAMWLVTCVEKTCKVTLWPCPSNSPGKLTFLEIALICATLFHRLPVTKIIMCTFSVWPTKPGFLPVKEEIHT